MKRKYREAMRAAARERDQKPDGEDEDAIEARDWFEKWAATPHRQDESSDAQVEMMK